MRILLLTDSLGLPRAKTIDQQLLFEDTWPQLLSKRFPNFTWAQASFASATSEDILYQCQYWRNFEPDLIFIQIGVCDALPRILHTWEVELLKLLPFRKSIQRGLSKHGARIRQFRKIQKVKPQVFKNNLLAIIAHFPTSKMFAVGIISSGKDPAHMPGAKEMIKSHNCILNTIFGSRLIHTDDIPKACIMPDHYHLNRAGHRWLSNRITPLLTRKKPLAPCSGD